MQKDIDNTVEIDGFKVSKYSIKRSTTVLSFRISTKDYLIYKEYISGIKVKKELLRSSIEKLIEKIARIKTLDDLESFTSQLEGINVHVVNAQLDVTPQIQIIRAEARADSRVDNRVDISNKVVIDMDSFNEVIQLLNETRKLISNWYRMNMIPLAAAKTVSEKLKKIEELLRSSN